MSDWPNAERFEPMPQSFVDQWLPFPGTETHDGRVFFGAFLDMKFEEVRRDYSRLRLPYRTEVCQPAGIIHGGAIASLIDTCVVPALASGYEERRIFFTVDMHVSYLDGLSEDAIGEGWIQRRGKSLSFCKIEVRGADSRKLAATGSLVYRLSSRPFPEAPGAKPMLG